MGRGFLRPRAAASGRQDIAEAAMLPCCCYIHPKCTAPKRSRTSRTSRATHPTATSAARTRRHGEHALLGPSPQLALPARGLSWSHDAGHAPRERSPVTRAARATVAPLLPVPKTTPLPRQPCPALPPC